MSEIAGTPQLVRQLADRIEKLERVRDELLEAANLAEPILRSYGVDVGAADQLRRAIRRAEGREGETG